MNGFSIKLMNTNLQVLTAWVNNGMTECYNGTYAVPGTGWQMITLQNQFVYDGTNLLVEICYDNTSYTYYSFVYGTTLTTNMTQYYYTDLPSGSGCGFTYIIPTTTRPNFRFVEQPWVGNLTGTVTSCYNNAPINGATVTVGTLSTTTNAAGIYTLYNIPVGTKTANYTATGYLPKSYTVTINNTQTTTQNACLNPIPAYLSGIVTNASTGMPVIGAKIQAGTSITVFYRSDRRLYLKRLSYGYIHSNCLQTGIRQFNGWPFTFTQGSTLFQNFVLLENTNPATNVVATLNTSQTAVDITWGTPRGNYMLLYDDGIQENWTIWADPNNMNAVKFTPVGYPANITGGMINIGQLSNYPSGGSGLKLFKIAIYDATGPGGTPGTAIVPPFNYTPTAYGWNTFTMTPFTVTSGSFYIVMIQQGSPPNAAGLGD